MQIIVHNVVRDGLIALHDVLVYRDYMHVFCDVITDYIIICEFIYEVNVYFGISLPARIRILSSRK